MERLLFCEYLQKADVCTLHKTICKDHIYYDEGSCKRFFIIVVFTSRHSSLEWGAGELQRKYLNCHPQHNSRHL